MVLINGKRTCKAGAHQWHSGQIQVTIQCCNCTSWYVNDHPQGIKLWLLFKAISLYNLQKIKFLISTKNSKQFWAFPLKIKISLYQKTIYLRLQNIWKAENPKYQLIYINVIFQPIPLLISKFNKLNNWQNIECKCWNCWSNVIAI